MPDPDDVTTEQDSRAEAEEGFLRGLGELLLLVLVAVLLATGIKTFVVQPFLIPSGSMLPTLQEGDRVLVNKFVYRLRDPRPGDVVVFTSPDSEDVDLIKRVIAVGGQTVEVRDGTVFVDGKALTEPYVNTDVPDSFTSDRPVRVPEGKVWVMGDNRTNSRDSRYFGPQPVDSLLGRAFFIYWPPGRWKAV